VLSLKVRLAEAEERVIRAVNSRLLSISALANLLGEDADARISLGADEDDGWLPADLPEQYEVAVAEAMARRPELLQARRIVERAAMDVDSRWLAYLPRADAGARVY
jgi:outer membrane protein TolC